MFLKVKRGESPESNFSETYSRLSRANRLYEVLQILKGIGQVVIP